MHMEKLKFPIGRFVKPKKITKSILNSWIEDIEEFSFQLDELMSKLSEEQLNMPYRPEGWTIRQVVHHCADSHMNSFIRFKLALTEDTPTIKPYFEDQWAELPDAKNFPIESSLQIIKGLHKRWSALLYSLNPEELKKAFIHPEHQTITYLDENIGIYAWHCKHHLAHIEQVLRKKE